MKVEYWNAGIAVFTGIALGCVFGLSIAAAAQGVEIKDALSAASQFFGWIIAVGAAALAFSASHRNINNQTRISNITILKTERDRLVSELPSIRRAKKIIDDIIIAFDFGPEGFDAKKREAINVFVRMGGGQFTSDLDDMVMRAVPNIPDYLAVQIVDALDFIRSPESRIETDDLGFDPEIMQKRYETQRDKLEIRAVRQFYDLQRSIDDEIKSANDVIRDFDIYRRSVIDNLRQTIRRPDPTIAVNHSTASPTQPNNGSGTS